MEAIHSLILTENLKYIYSIEMLGESNSPLVLVYFQVRGKLQPIRNLCCHLALPVIEVHLENDDSKRQLPEEVKATLRGIKIDKSSLPILVHDGMLIYQPFPIMNYICRKFGAEHLLGTNILQRAKVNELVELILNKESNLVGEFFKMAEECVQKCNETIGKEKFVVYQRSIRESGYIGELSGSLEKKNEGKSFILDTLTLVDFLFLETSHLMLGLFSSIVEKNKCSLEGIFKGLFSCGKPVDNVRYLRVMENYVGFIYHQPFYQRNQQFLQSFTMMCPSFPKPRIDGLRKIWGYNNNFVL